MPPTTLTTLIQAGLLQEAAGIVRVAPPWLWAFLAGEPHPGSAPITPGGHWGRNLIIGLTGNIATGKSTVLAKLAALGSDVIDADKVVHALREPGAPGHTAIVEQFGTDYLLPDGRIDNQKLGALAFSDSNALRRLERIFGPLAVAEIARRAQASRAAVIVIEAIRLLDGDLKHQVDHVWVVDADTAQQVARLVRDRGLTKAQALTRIEAQPPQAEKRAQAHVIIRNDGDLSATHRQILAAWDDVLSSLHAAGWLSADLVKRYVATTAEINPDDDYAKMIYTALRTLSEKPLPPEDVAALFAAD